jgi:membrane-associated protein
MEWVHPLLDVVLHLDQHLFALVREYGAWVYGILFTIIFCETGLIVTPFLPGDSLLFAAGAVAATGALDPLTLAALLIFAAVLGDNVNYAIGHWLGPMVFQSERSRLFNRQHLERTRRFYEKYGVKTVVLARFAPILRTFSPFIAGIGRMHYPRFLGYDVGGGILWISTFIGAGYFFGNIPVVKSNFSLVILAIIAISLLPAVVEYWRARAQPNLA